MACLGHVISAKVLPWTSRRCVVVEWPTPHSVRVVCGFLGLVSYYHKFIRGYRALATPLPKLFKREVFSWTKEVDLVFQGLHDALTIVPVL